MSSYDKSFRKLCKDDIYQTTDQWKERALRRIGEVSGKWTAWVERDSIPTVPERRPIEPVKPTSEDLLTPIKERLRLVNLINRLKQDPNAKIEDIPVPTNHECWVDYHERMGTYETEKTAYERKVKLATVTYPDENEKVFSTLLDCISEGSIQELKRIKEGETFFNDHDSYNFFKLAIKEHEYLPPDISSAAVARAKEDFESLRQKAEDSFTDHFNEFRRRYEVLLKTRGKDTGIPYADYDLRDLLLKSLYAPAWSSWKEYRKATGTLPKTFDGVALELKKAESERIFESSHSIDPHMPSAHTTKGSPPSPLPTTSPGGTSKCQCCGSTFSPKRPSHIRCDKCQHDYTSRRKSERKKSSDSGSKKKVKPRAPKSPTKKVHSTTVDDDESEEDSDSDQEPDNDATAHYTSFSCICSTSGSRAHVDDLVYFDNCSNLNIIRDRALALNICQEKTTTKITGSIPGTLTANVSADIGDLGRGCFNPSFSRNLISEDSVLKAGYRVTRDSDQDRSYTLHKDGRPPLIFRGNSEGTFSISSSELRSHFRDLYTTANSTDIDRTSLVFTKRQRERAALYHQDHATCLGHIHHDRIIQAIRTGILTNVPYTEADIRNAQVIYGPCPFCSRTKGTKHAHTGAYPDYPNSPGEHLAGDLFTIMGILFSIITCRLVKLRCVTRLRNKGASEVTRAVREAVNIWKGYGGSPRILSWDQEPALVHSASEIWAQHSLRLRFTSPDSHERVSERDVRTIKEHVYASILSLQHAVDEEMVEGLVRDVTTLLNFLPNSELPASSARTALDGERLNYDRWRRVHAGQVAEFELPYAQNLKTGSRREIGYVIGHQGDNPIVRLLPAGKRLVIRSGHIKPIEKTSAIISLIEQGITGAKRQRFNDLLAEIQDFFSESDVPSSPDSEDSTTLTVATDTQPRPLIIPRAPPSERVESIPSTNHDFPTEDPPEPVSVAPPTTPSVQGRADNPHGPTIEESTGLDAGLPELIHETSTPRRPTRAGAQKPPGFYRKLHSGESVADYTACHMRAEESERLYGKPLTHQAGITEVTNMIKTRDAADPQDYRKLTPRQIREALPSFMFYKAKDETPEPVPLDTPTKSTHSSWTKVISKREQKKAKKIARKIRLRARWVGGGHRQKRSDILAERVAPTARGATHNLLMAIASPEGRQLHVGDIPSAYLQADHKPADGKPVLIIADKHTSALIAEAHPEYADYIMPNGTMILKVKKAMYGLVESAWLWYKELEKHLTGIGYKVSPNDRALFHKRIVRDGKCIASNIASVHVDDIASAASPNKEGKELEEEFWNSMEAKWPGIKRQSGPHYRHLSWNIYQDPKTKEISKSQRDYIQEVVKASGVEKEFNLPSRSNILEEGNSSEPLPSQGVSTFRSTLQKIAYAREGRPDIDFTVSYLQTKQNSPTKQDWEDLAHLLGYLKKFPERIIKYSPKDMQLRGFADASYNITTDARSHYGYIVTLGNCLVASKGGRIKTVVRSSTEAEISAVNELISDILWCRDILEDLGYPQQKINMYEDNKSCITMLQQEPRNFHTKSRHVRVKWAFFREEYEKQTVKLRYCPTEKMVADLLTKPLGGKAHTLHSDRIFNGCEP